MTATTLAGGPPRPAEGLTDEPGNGPLTVLRGAEPRRVSARSVGAAAGGLCVAMALTLCGVLTAAGVAQNSRTADLQHHGVSVVVKVTSCLGQLGGSGSNPVGYTCTGTFRLDGHRYAATLPGSGLHPLGSLVAEMTPAEAPGPLATAASVRTASTSGRVFIAPSVLAAAGLGGLWVLVRKLRRRPRAGQTAPAPA